MAALFKHRHAQVVVLDNRRAPAAIFVRSGHGPSLYSGLASDKPEYREIHKIGQPNTKQICFMSFVIS